MERGVQRGRRERVCEREIKRRGEGMSKGGVVKKTWRDRESKARRWRW